MKPITIVFLIILLISGQFVQAGIINDSIPAGKNFERAVFRLWFPDDLKVLKGIVVLVPGSNSDGRGQVSDTIWQSFAKRHGFALLGCWYTDYQTVDMFIERYAEVSKGSGQALIEIIKRFSVSSGHSELDAAPLLLWGHSAGGQFNYEFACWNPQRVIAFVVNKGGIYYTAMAPKATRSVPCILFTGENDLDARKDIIKGLFSMNRRAGAQWIYAPEPEAGHEIGQTKKLALVFFDEVISLRMSNFRELNSNQQLKPLNESDGFIGDHKSQTISLFSEDKKYDYPVSWFPGRKTAEAWVAFIHKKPFTQETQYGNNSKAGKYYYIRGIKLYAEEYGAGKPLLLLHGNGGSISSMSSIIPYFSNKYRTIVLDSRAHGKSIDTGDSLSFEMMADDVASLLDQMKIDSAYIIGWSDGGIIALETALRHPEKIRKLASTGANLWPDSTALIPGLWNDEKKYYDSQKDKPRISNDEKNNWKIFMLDWEQPIISLASVSKIHTPSLIICGDHDIIRIEHTVQIFQNIPGSKLWILPNSGHATLIEYPDKFCETVDQFFSSASR